MRDVLLKLVRTIHVIVVCVVPDDDAGILHHILDEAESWEVRIRERFVGVWPIFYTHKF